MQKYLKVWHDCSVGGKDGRNTESKQYFLNCICKKKILKYYFNNINRIEKRSLIKPGLTITEKLCISLVRKM